MTSAASTLPRAARRTRAGARRLGTWIRTSAWLLASVGALAGIAFVLFIHRGDAEGGARIANREIELRLDRGERVEQRIPVMQRYWWDYFRVTHGVLAATDRRLLFVGVPPGDLLPREEEPLELVELSFPYDRPLDVRFGRVFLETRQGMEIRAGGRQNVFAFSAIDRGRADSVVAVMEGKQRELRAAAEAERRATEAAVAASRRAIYHLVQRGEALGLIARRYGVPVDSIVKWNDLPSTRITAGRRLLVKPES